MYALTVLCKQENSEGIIDGRVDWDGIGMEGRSARGGLVGLSPNNVG